MGCRRVQAIAWRFASYDSQWFTLILMPKTPTVWSRGLSYDKRDPKIDLFMGASRFWVLTVVSFERRIVSLLGNIVACVPAQEPRHRCKTRCHAIGWNIIRWVISLVHLPPGAMSFTRGGCRSSWKYIWSLGATKGVPGKHAMDPGAARYDPRNVWVSLAPEIYWKRINVTGQNSKGPRILAPYS